MSVSYNKLFKLLIDKNMKKKELCRIAGISSTSLSKLKNGQNVNIDIINKICEALNCNIEDVVEIIHDTNKEED